MRGVTYLANEIAKQAISVAELLDVNAELREQFQNVLAVLTPKQKEKLGLGDS